MFIRSLSCSACFLPLVFLVRLVAPLRLLLPVLLLIFLPPSLLAVFLRFLAILRFLLLALLIGFAGLLWLFILLLG